MPQDAVPKDIKHVVPVVGEGKWVDERVEVDDGETDHGGEGGPEECACVRKIGTEGGAEGGEKEGEGEEGYEWPDVEHLC